MSNHSFRSSRPDAWVSPRSHRDPTARLNHYGPLQPMSPDNPKRGTIRLTVLSALAFIASALLLHAFDPQAGSASPEAPQPAVVHEPGGGDGDGE